jgi:phosphoribosylformimino-5-aminoimidazole carboxamide ribonucleotide (ProFAR) isomerase
MDLLMVGAEGAVIATKTTRGMQEIEEAADLFEDVIVSIDYDGKLLARNRKLADKDPVDFAKEAARMGVRRFVFADYRRHGVDEKIVGLLVRHCPELYVGGGIRSAHCDRLATLGVKGAVLELSDVMECLE